MRKDKHIYYELGGVIKKFGLYALVFLFSFGFASMLKNSINGTYAINERACPVGTTNILGNYCCPSVENGDVNYSQYYGYCTTSKKDDGNCPDGYEPSGIQCRASVVPFVTAYTATFKVDGTTLEEVECSVESDGKCYIYAYNYPEPTKAGQIFNGWSAFSCSDTGGFTKDNLSKISLSNDITYNACWKDGYKVTFDSINGKIEKADDTFVTKIETKCTVEDDGNCYFYKKDIPTPTKSGYIFNGWTISTISCKESGGFTNKNYPKDKIQISKDTLYNACWLDGYTATFNSNGGKESDKNIKCTPEDNGKCMIYIKDVPTANRDGYTFKGWNLNVNGDFGFTQENYQDFSISENITYYAIWEYDESGNTEQDPNPGAGGTENPDSGTGGQGTTTPTSKTFEVTFDPNSGMGSTSIETCTTTTDTCTLPASKIPSVSRQGFYFNGWNTTPTCTNGVSQIILNQDATYYACWEAVPTGGSTQPGQTPNTYTVTYNSNGGNEGNRTIRCTIENDGRCYIYTRDIPTITREGYKFNGWTENFCPTEEVVTGNDSTAKINITRNITYYACWISNSTTQSPTQTNEYVVTFNLSGGTLYKNNVKANVNTYTLKNLNYADYTAKKDGFTFIGWRTNSENCSNAKTNTVLNSLSSNLNLFACYEQTKSDIEENPNTGSLLLYIVYFIGFGAFAYTVYYILKLKKIKN